MDPPVIPVSLAESLSDESSSSLPNGGSVTPPRSVMTRVGRMPSNGTEVGTEGAGCPARESAQ
eukprot:15460751-Alexandrium_andersonii.AAC.1